MVTAEKVYKDILKMSVPEREKLFATIARKGFEKDLYAHDEVFDEIRKSSFSLKEAAPTNRSRRHQSPKVSLSIRRSMPVCHVFREYVQITSLFSIRLNLSLLFCISFHSVKV